MIAFYILTGIIIGPLLGIIKNMQVVDVLSEIGIAFLLFIVGIELDLDRLKEVGKVSSVGALVQMAISFLLGFGVFQLIGFEFMPSLYAGIVLMFSSTMVVIKLLSDKSQLDTLHGRIVIGTLLMQDVVAVVVLSLLSHTGGGVGLVFAGLQGLLVFVVALFFSKVIFPQLFKFAAKSQELFFLLSITVCFLFALIFSSIGFSIAIGAFIAGLMLGNLPYNVEIVSKVKNLRDFFATVFFVSIGIKLTFHTLADFTVPLVFLFLLTSIIIPIITYSATLLFGYSRKVSFLVAISLSQVSEFALIAVHQGIVVGHITEGFQSLVIIATLLTIIATSYFIKYEDALYRKIIPFLRRIDNLFGRTKQFTVQTPHALHSVILIGYDRIGSRIFNSLQKLKKDTLVVDFNPDVISHLMEQQVPCLYGDAADEEVVENMHLPKASLIISTIPHHRDTLLLIRRVREVNPFAKIIVTAYIVEQALYLYEAGADYVILPHLLGGEHAGVLLEEVSGDLDKLISTKLAHIDELKRHGEKTYYRRKQYSNTL
jgi:Kef-type K+ transport system membrane component KefB